MLKYRYSGLLQIPKKLRKGHLLRPGSDTKGPDPTGSVHLTHGNITRRDKMSF
jgi:hypothetical protein